MFRLILFLCWPLIRTGMHEPTDGPIYIVCLHLDVFNAELDKMSPRNIEHLERKSWFPLTVESQYGQSP